MTVEARRSLSLTRTVSNGIECSAVLSIGLMELNLGQGRGTANARMTQSRKTPDKCMPDLINMAMISKIDNDDIEDPSQLPGNTSKTSICTSCASTVCTSPMFATIFGSAAMAPPIQYGTQTGPRPVQSLQWLLPLPMQRDQIEEKRKGKNAWTPFRYRNGQLGIEPAEKDGRFGHMASCMAALPRRTETPMRVIMAVLCVCFCFFPRMLTVYSIRHQL